MWSLDGVATEARVRGAWAETAFQFSERPSVWIPAMRFVEDTRQHEAILAGVSTRGAVSWMRMAKARALLEKRDYVIPDDLQALAMRVLAHRLVLRRLRRRGNCLGGNSKANSYRIKKCTSKASIVEWPSPRRDST
jgi:hypothetical protein